LPCGSIRKSDVVVASIDGDESEFAVAEILFNVSVGGDTYSMVNAFDVTGFDPVAGVMECTKGSRAMLPTKHVIAPTIFSTPPNGDVRVIIPWSCRAKQPFKG